MSYLTPHVDLAKQMGMRTMASMQAPPVYGGSPITPARHHVNQAVTKAAKKIKKVKTKSRSAGSKRLRPDQVKAKAAGMRATVVHQKVNIPPIYVDVVVRK